MAEAKKRKKRKVGINSNGTLSKPWQKFFDKLDAINHDQVPVRKWDDTHVLAYICKRFRDHFGHAFSFSLAGPPSKCPELYCVKRMRYMLLGPHEGANPITMKSYVDWVFEKKVIEKDRPLVSMGYFITAGVCNEFKAHCAKNNKIIRSTPFPPKYLSIAESLGISKEEVSTYGDVAFVKMAIEQDPEGRDTYREFIRHIESFGFDSKILERLEQ